MKQKFSGLILSFLVAGSVFAQAPASDTEKKSVQEYVELMRKDLRAEKHSIVDEAMALEPANKAKFWAIYDQYEKENKALWDSRLGNVKKYAENYEKMSDQVADELATGVFANEQSGTNLRKKYYGQMKTALGAKAAARFVQVESVLERLVGLQLSANLPLIQ